VSTPTPISAVSRTPEFERDLKKLLKRYSTLEQDLQTFIAYELALFHGRDLAVGGIERVAGLGFGDPPVYVAKRFACKALRGTGSRSGIRVVYAWFESERRIELVELYYKGDKAVEDRVRLRRRYRERWSDR
jgi:hypothetical protein